MDPCCNFDCEENYEVPCNYPSQDNYPDCEVPCNFPSGNTPCSYQNYGCSCQSCVNPCFNPNSCQINSACGLVGSNGTCYYDRPCIFGQGECKL